VAGALETVAFRNHDDGSVVLLVCNAGPEALRFSVAAGGRVLQATQPRESVATYVWQPGP